MSDLLRDNGPSGTPLGRAQNGSGQLLPQEPPRMRTPRDVMEQRRLREAARQRQQEQQQDARRRQQAEAAGVEGDTRLPSAAPSRSYNIGGRSPEAAGATLPGRQPETADLSSPQVVASSFQQPQQQIAFEPSHTRVSSTTQRNRTEAFERLNMTATAQPAGAAAAGAAARVTAGAAQPAAPQPATTSSIPRLSRQEPQLGALHSRTGSRFPHAFERWEQLSAQWEGLTSHWLRRLQNNANELEGKPIEQQMARQIADLSAAGANLFHAVVELQRLRASSERKFQRWFFETREEQEQAAERQAELEKQLRLERDARITAQAAGTDAAVRAEKARAEEMVREMRRELQISKEEARRAWEELGRREQEERDRINAMRSGEPAIIGGVHVVPVQSITSRLPASVGGAQAHAQRSGGDDDTSTYRAAPTQVSQAAQGSSARPVSRTTSTSLDSPGEEARQFTYQPQPASNDPFIESAPTQQPITTGASGSTSAVHRSPPSNQPSTSNGHSAASRFYQQPSPQTTIHQPLGTLPGTTTTTAAAAAAAAASPHAQYSQQRPLTGSDTGRSYQPSSTSLLSAEEDYHVNPDGSYTLDSSGRRIPYHQPLMEEYSTESEAIGEIPSQREEESDEDYTSDIAREQAYAREYAASTTRRPVPSSLSQQHPSTSVAEHGSSSAKSSAAAAEAEAELEAESEAQARAEAAAAAAAASERRHEQESTTPDYSGADYEAGWEDVPLSTSRHRHPTRLSDIIEEQASRTSPSRGSYPSGSAAGGGLIGPR